MNTEKQVIEADEEEGKFLLQDIEEVLESYGIRGILVWDEGQQCLKDVVSLQINGTFLQLNTKD